MNCGEVIPTSEIFFSYVSTLKSTETKFGSRANPGSRPSRCQPAVTFGKNPKIPNRDLASVGPAYRCQSVPGMFRDGLNQFGSIYKRVNPGNDQNATYGNRKVSLCNFKL